MLSDELLEFHQSDTSIAHFPNVGVMYRELKVTWYNMEQSIWQNIDPDTSANIKSKFPISRIGQRWKFTIMAKHGTYIK